MKPVIACSVFLLVCCPNAAAQPVAPSPTGLHLVEAVQSAISRHPALEFQQQEVEIARSPAAGGRRFRSGSGQAFDQGRLYSRTAG